MKKKEARCFVFNTHGEADMFVLVLHGNADEVAKARTVLTGSKALETV